MVRRKSLLMKLTLMLLALSPVLIETHASTWWWGEPTLPTHLKRQKTDSISD